MSSNKNDKQGKVSKAQTLINEIIIAASFQAELNDCFDRSKTNFKKIAKRPFETANQDILHSEAFSPLSKQVKSIDYISKLDNVSDRELIQTIEDEEKLDSPKAYSPAEDLERDYSAINENSSFSNNQTANFVITELKEPLNQQIVLTEEQLAEIPVKDLNSLLRGLPDNEVLKLKQKRRTIKNRGYAQTSRMKRTTQKSMLENEKMTLEEQLEHYARENELLKKERDDALHKLEALKRFSELNGIILTTNEETLTQLTLSIGDLKNENKAVDHI
ncbi:uncharacterized protein LOC100199133 [Hydra vulgaris]|uniref:Uncharacterized protein LOC100199133 n=1 Tax=Hydra vulgaris TaxID=6087 RepID=A0ABM4BR39_HYDVU